MLKLGAFILAAIIPVMSFAAIVFEPVQYQYRDPVHGRPFFYGGGNPEMIVAGQIRQMRMSVGTDPVRNIGFHETFIGPRTSDLLHHSAEGDICVTLSDLLPLGANAFPLGLTPDDARNQAYASTPRFFRVGDLMHRALLMPDGNLVVPPQAMPGTIQITPMHKTAAPTTQPTSQPIIIIPKGLLDKKLAPAPRTPIAAAN